MQQPQPLARDLAPEPVDPRDVGPWSVEAADEALLNGIAARQEYDWNLFVLDALAAKTELPPPAARITAALRSTRSAASAGNRSIWFSAKRY